MKEETINKIECLLDQQLRAKENGMKEAILKGDSGKYEFEEYKRCVIAVNDFENFIKSV